MRTLCVDPGEETGWSIWSGNTLLGSGQTKLWEFAFDVDSAVVDNVGPLAEGEEALLRPGIEPEQNVGPFGLFVIEKFAIYPWAAKDLAWDEVRTAQLIGALTFIASKNGIEVTKQPATIKDGAKAAGADELFVKPLHENRHQNDSIMHGVYWNAMQRGNVAKVKDGGAEHAK